MIDSLRAKNGEREKGDKERKEKIFKAIKDFSFQPSDNKVQSNGQSGFNRVRLERDRLSSPDVFFRERIEKNKREEAKQIDWPRRLSISNVGVTTTTTKKSVMTPRERKGGHGEAVFGSPRMLNLRGEKCRRKGKTAKTENKNGVRHADALKPNPEKGDGVALAVVVDHQMSTLTVVHRT